MSGSKDTIKTTFSGHSNINPVKHKPNQVKGGAAVHSFFGLETGNKYVKRVKILFKDGRRLSIPYALLPTIIYEPDHGIRLQTAEFTVHIQGRSLLRLEEYLSNEQVRWIKESPSGIDTENDDVFIQSIEVRGELNM